MVTGTTFDIALKHAMALVIIEPKGIGNNNPINEEITVRSSSSDIFLPYAMLESGNTTGGGTPGAPDGTPF